MPRMCVATCLGELAQLVFFGLRLLRGMCSQGGVHLLQGRHCLPRKKATNVASG
jgi:hypothetical protein